MRESPTPNRREGAAPPRASRREARGTRTARPALATGIDLLNSTAARIGDTRRAGDTRARVPGDRAALEGVQLCRHSVGRDDDATTMKARPRGAPAHGLGWKRVAVIAAGMMGHSYSIGSIFSYVGIMAVDLGWAPRGRGAAGFVASRALVRAHGRAPADRVALGPRRRACTRGRALRACVRGDLPWATRFGLCRLLMRPRCSCAASCSARATASSR